MTISSKRLDRTDLFLLPVLIGTATLWAVFAGQFETLRFGLILCAPWVLACLLPAPDRTLWLILLLIPFAPTLPGGATPRTIDFILPALLLGFWSLHLAYRFVPVRLLPRSLTLWFAAFVLWTAFAACFSTAPAWGWWQVAVYLIHFLVLLAFWNLWSRRKIEVGVILVVLGTLVVAAFGVYQVFSLGITAVLFGEGFGPERLRSFYDNPGPLGLMMCYGLVITVPILLLRLTAPRTMKNLLLTAGLTLAVAAFLVTLLSSFSRASYLYAAAGILTLLWIYRRLRWIVLGGAAATMMGLFLLPVPTWLFFGLRLSSGASYRTQLFRAGWNMMLDHPLTGIGPGPGVFESYRPFYVTTLATRGLDVTKFGAAHNITLTKGAELGIPGLVLMIVFHVLLLRLVPRALRAYRNGDWLAGAAAAGAVGITVRGMFETGGTLYTGHLDDTIIGSLFLLILYGVGRPERWGPVYRTEPPTE